MAHVEGAPLGTRGGLSVTHVFPADGDYVFRLTAAPSRSATCSAAPPRGEQIEISIDGERVALFDINPRMNEAIRTGLNMTTPPIHVTAGPHRVSAAFICSGSTGPVDDLLAPIEHTLADTEIGDRRSASRRCRTCATSPSPARSRSPACPTR